MRILILGAGKMGTFLTDVLCMQHEVALFDVNPKNLRFVFNTYRMTTYEEIREFEPELLINCVSLNHTIDAFNAVLPYLPKSCIISDIASVKTGLPEFYANCGMRYVSTHPMFGPTFANLEAEDKSPGRPIPPIPLEYSSKSISLPKVLSGFLLDKFL